MLLCYFVLVKNPTVSSMGGWGIILRNASWCAYFVIFFCSPILKGCAAMVVVFPLHEERKS